jgi:hypothetical protein
MGWGFLVPKTVWPLVLTIGGAVLSVVSRIEFANTVTVGSIIVASSVIVLGGVFTLRNNMRSFWRNLAEERAAQVSVLEQDIKERDGHIRDLQEQGRADLARLAEEERTVRHELKNQLAAATMALDAERAKTDLSSLMELLAHQHAEAMDRVNEVFVRQERFLQTLLGRGWGEVVGRESDEGDG